MWQLKKNQPPFEVVDGPMAGRKFTHGQDYMEIPPGQEFRFEHSGESVIAAMGATNTDAIAQVTGRKNRKAQEEVADAEQ